VANLFNHSAIFRRFESKRDVERDSKMLVVFTVTVSCSTDDSAINGDRITEVMFQWVKGKAVPVQAWSGPEGSRQLRFPDFMTTAQWWSGCQPYPPAAFAPRKYSWYSFLLEAESTPGP
jgi:hypothetical protein